MEALGMFRPLAIFNRNNSDNAPVALSTPDPFFRLQHEVNRLFDDAFAGFGQLSRFAPELHDIRSPRINVRETDAAFEVEAELPGVDEKDIDVQLSDNTLTIRGEKRAERKEEKEGEYRLVERSFGSFARSIEIPFPVDGDSVEATFRNGVLHLSLPKPPEAASKTRKIAVKRG
jgi:HSP20 family protein